MLCVRISHFLLSGIVVLGLSTAVLAIEPPPAVLTGRIAEFPEQFQLARRKLGDHGILSIRSAERWRQVADELVSLGWKQPEAGPHATVDYRQQMLVLVYKNGDEQNQFSLAAYDREAARLGVAMSYVIHKQSGERKNRCNFLLLAVDLAPKLEVTVATYHPQNGGKYPTIEKAQLEWKGAVGTDAGDVIDGLRGSIAAAPVDAVRKGDIVLRFTLEFVSGAVVKDGAFAVEHASAFVWDGKYSNGYRNHAFLVHGPGGKSQFLRPKEIADWSKNAPHPVEVTAGSPYTLPNWVVGTSGKSLLELGLQAQDSGDYAITGIYQQAAGKGILRGAEMPMWGGNLGTNTLTIRK